MGCDHDQRTPKPEVVDHGRSQRSTFDRVSAGAKFVHEDKPGERQTAVHRDEIRNMTRKCGEAGPD